MPIDLAKIQDSIAKTGFQLEYKVGCLLRSNGWHLISNRCYVDDLEGTVREIDLLAYKVSHVDGISLYTTLIISCKKSDANAWALLSRKVEQQDPNYSWRTFKGWSNDPALTYYLSQKNWPDLYHNELSKDCPKLFEPPQVDVFAFQEMHKINGTSQNDKNIFASITSLMKAQSYEMSILNGRHENRKRIYQFNLVSLIDSELIRLYFEGDEVVSELIDSEDYLCRYILNGEETAARIKFVTAQAFPDLIQEYSRLHQKNIEVFRERYALFYSDAFKTPAKAKLLIGEFNKKIKSRIMSARYQFEKNFNMSDVSIDYYPGKNYLSVELDLNDGSQDMLEAFNNDAQLKEAVSRTLKDIFHYEGKFIFDFAIPF